MSSSIPSQTRKCPDCGGSLSEITTAAPGGPAGLVYSEPSKVTGLWAKMNERRAWGSISTLMCGGCHRIFFYGGQQSSTAPAGEGLLEKFFKRTE